VHGDTGGDRAERTRVPWPGMASEKAARAGHPPRKPGRLVRRRKICLCLSLVLSLIFGSSAPGQGNIQRSGRAGVPGGAPRLAELLECATAQHVAGRVRVVCNA